MEILRLQFILQRDGPEAALAFAKQALKLYREAVSRKNLNKSIKGIGYPTRGYRTKRREFILSCLDLRDYIRTKGNKKWMI